jgi:prevent-host-death family protein
METDKTNSVTAQEMRNQLSDLLNRAAYLREPTLVTRQGKAVAVLV